MRLRNVILASHGALSKGMYDSVKMIAGENSVKNVVTFSLQPGECASDYAHKLQAEIEQHTNDEFVIISDVFGGSVHSALMQILTCDNVVLFCGMNMALVLEVVMLQKPLDAKERKRLCESGCEGIKCFTQESISVTQEQEDF